MKRVLSLICLGVFAFVSYAPAPAQAAPKAKDLWADCLAHDINIVISACTSIIDKKGNPGNLARAHFNRGKALAQRGNRRGAIADFNEVIRLQPRNSNVYARRALAHSSLFNYKESEADIDTAIRLAPREASFRGWRGWLYKTIGQDEKARADFTRMLALLEQGSGKNRQQAERFYWRGVALTGLDRNEAALTEFSNAIRVRPDYEEAYRDRGVVNTHRGNVDQAIADWAEALRIQPDYADVLRWRGLAHADKHSYDAALADFERMLALNADDERAYHGRGYVHRLRKDYDRAIDDTNQAIRLIPDYAVAYSNRGWAYFNKGAFDRAILDFSRAISLNSKMLGAYDGRGQAYRELKDYPHAIADFDELIRLAPTVNNYAGRAHTHWLARDKRALDDLSETIRLSPDDASLYRLRAQAYFLFREPAKTLADLDTALRLKPDDAHTYMTRAHLHTQILDFDRTIEDTSAAIKLRPDLVEAYTHRAFAYRRKNELDKALTDTNEAVRLAPDKGGGYKERAGIYEERGDHERALEDFNTAVRMDPKNIWSFIWRGHYFYRRSQYDRAIADYNAAIDLEPDFYFAYNLRGSAYTQKNEYDRALADYDRALQLEPNDASIRGNLADVFRSTGDFERALAEADAFIKSKPEDPDSFLKRGWVYIGKNDFDKALADFNQAIRLDRAGGSASFLARGILYIRKGEAQRAIADLDKAIELKPDSSSAYLQRGEAYFALGDYDRALADLNETIRLQSPPDPSPANLRGVVHMMRRDYASALKDFDEAVGLDPGDPIFRANRAKTLIELNRIDEAKQEVEAGLKLGTERGALLEVQGTISLLSEKYAEAADDLSESMRLGVNTPRVYARRGTAYEKQGLRALALADYRKASELDAPNPLQRDARVLARERIAALEASGLANGKKPAIKTYDLGRRVALAVGVSDYEAATFLPNPRNDARAMAEAFRRLGFSEVVEVIDPTRSQLEEAVKSFGDKAAGADWAVIFYAGHGMQIDGRNFLIPKDAKLLRASHAEYEAFPLDRVMNSAADAKKLGMVILDSCRNNPFIARMSQEGRLQRSLGVGLARVEPQRGELVAFATRDGHLAADGKDKNSPYTQALLAHIEEPDVDIRLLFGKVRDRVLELTMRTQEPFTYGSLPGETLFFKVSN